MRKILLVIEEYKDLINLENLLRRLGFDVLSLGKEVLVNDALLRFQPEITIVSGKGRVVDGFRVAARVKKLAPPSRVALIYVPGTIGVIAPDAQALLDAMISMPLQPRGLIKVVAQLGNLEADPLIEKYHRITSKGLQGDDARDDDAATFVTGGKKTPGQNTEGSRYVQSTPGNAKLNPDTTRSKADQAKSQLLAEDPWANIPEEFDPVKTPGQATKLRTARSDRYDRFLSDQDDGPVSGVMPRDKSTAAMRQLKKDSEKEKDKLDKIEEEKRAFAKALFEEGGGGDGGDGKDD